jgi:hypothetical protein
MDMHNPRRFRESGARSAGHPVEDETPLVPILARAAETGRGPPWLVGWVRGQLAGLGCTRLPADPAVVRRLARELARLLRGPGLTDTVPDRPAEGRRVGSP